MVELRLLEQHTRGNTTLREEAIRVSTILSLVPADLISDISRHPATAFLRGARLSAVDSVRGQLPPLRDPAARLHIAIGAALARAAKTKSPLVLTYAYSADLSVAEWKPILSLAASNRVPILFVLLPAATRAKNPGKLSLAATKFGVPGIPVDAADAVALYRVAQESMLRIRSGAGPVLIECIPFQLPGRRSEPTDPITTMQQFMLPRGVASEPWFESVASRCRARLNASGK